jgi:ferredoxin-NADP reductase
MKNTIRLQLLIGVILLSSCFGELTFPSSYVKIPNSGLTLYFEFNEANSSVLLGLDLAQDADYFAVGFADRGNIGMKNFDVVAFTFALNPDGNTYTTGVSDLYANRYGPPPSDISLNGTSDYFLVDSYVAKGRRQVLCVRAIDTKDQYDYVLDPAQTRYKVVMNWAWAVNGKGSVGYHGDTNRGTVIAPLVNGYQGTAETYTTGGFWTPALILALHGYLMLFGWGFLADVALQIARYRKSNRFYMIIHACLMVLLYPLTGAAMGFVLWMNWGQIFGTLPVMHYYAGLFIFGVLTLQMIFGLLLAIKITRDKLTQSIPSLSKGHAIGGILLYILTKAQLAMGLYMYKPNFLGALLAYYLVLFTFRISEEYRYRKKDPIAAGNHKIAQKEDSFDEKHRQLMTLLNSNTPLSHIRETPELKDLKWAIFEDKVFAIKNFDHPGGNFILNEINGQEISRFIYGAYGLVYPPNFTQHAHTKHALQIMEKNFIGTIQNGHNVLLAKDDTAGGISSTLERDQHINTSSYYDNAITNKSKLLSVNLASANSNWMLADKKQITPYLAKFEFKCKDYFVSSSVHDIRHLGRHMKVSHFSLPKTRLYTLVLSQTDFRSKRRDLLWKRYVKKNSSLVDFSSMSRSETLPLIIKNYDFPGAKTFSSLVHQSPLGSEGFNIEGPFGHGFGLTAETTGVHTIYAAGTGILPFLDLFDYLLESVLEESNHVVNIFRNGFRLHVYASFINIADFVGLDICEKLTQACTESGFPDAFRLTVKASNTQASEFFKTTNRDFDTSFISSTFDTNCQKVFVCGPPKFNDSIPQDLKSLGFPAERIILA